MTMPSPNCACFTRCPARNCSSREGAAADRVGLAPAGVSHVAARSAAASLGRTSANEADPLISCLGMSLRKREGVLTSLLPHIERRKA